MNCGAPIAGPYCAACGQRVRAGRLTVGGVLRHVAGELSVVDHGLLFTALGVMRRPGRVAREYVQGCTVRYVSPVRYFLVLVGAAQLVALRIGLLDEMVAGLLHGFYQDKVPSGAQATAVGLLTRYFVSVSALGVPLFAMWTRRLFARAGLNYAEHLVFALYTGAQQIALFTLVAWLIAAVRLPWADAAYLLVALVYQLAALRAFTGVSRAQTAWRLLVAAGLTLLSGTLLLAIAFTLLGRRA